MASNAKLASSSNRPTSGGCTLLCSEYRQRKFEKTDKFNAVLIIPTGIGAEIGGHAGDATAVSRMIAEIVDTLVLHPNVVNASDINEMD